MPDITQIKQDLVAWFTLDDFLPLVPCPEYITDSHNDYILRTSLASCSIVETEDDNVSGYAAYKANAALREYFFNDSSKDKKLKLPQKDFTISFWTKRFYAGIQTTHILGIFDLDTVGVTTVPCLRVFVEYGVDPTQPLLHVQVGDGTNYDDVQAGWAGDTGDWVHIAVVYRRSLGCCGMVDFYKNGQSFLTSFYQSVRFQHANGHEFSLWNGNLFADTWDNHRTALDEVALWSRALSEAEIQWLYQSGSGYGGLPDPAPADDECAKEIRCTPPDDFAYAAETATQDDGTCGEEIKCCDENLFGYSAPEGTVVSRARDHLGHAPPGDQTCPAVITVLVVPSGSLCVHFPLTVGLIPDDPRAYIVYTIDGTDPAPDQSGSTLLYTDPIILANPYIPLKFRPVIDGCSDYPIQSASFEDCGAFDFAWLCTNTDYVGTRGVWVPDGNDDHNWNLRFDFDIFTARVDQVDIYELDENMEWTTGQAWSTAAILYPYPTEPDKPYAAYPLWVEEAGPPAVPLVVGYVTTIGNFTGLNDWDLFGNVYQPAPTNHYFLIKFHTEAGIQQAVIPADTCTAKPPVCAGIPILATPGCDTSCNQYVDLAWNITPADDGGTYVLYRTRRCIDWNEMQVIDVGAGSTGPMAFKDENLPERCEIRYVLEYTHPSGCVSNEQIIVQTLGCPTIELELDSDALGPSDDITVTVISRYFDAGALSCGATISVELNGNPWFAATPNVTESTTIDISAAIDGLNTITAKACNVCGEVVATATFTKYGVAACPGSGEAVTIGIREFAGPGAPPSEFDNGIPREFICQTGNAPRWDGKLYKEGGGCFWSLAIASAWWENEDGGQFLIDPRIGGPGITDPPAGGAAAYYILIYGCCCEGALTKGLLWCGYKAYGNTPAGTYTFAKSMLINGGLNTATLDGPPTLTVVDLT